MKYLSIAEDVSELTGVSVDVLQLIYKKMFKCMRDKLRNIDTSNICSKEEFIKLKSSFNLQHLGKLYLNYKVINKINNYKYDCKRNTANVQQLGDNG